MRFLKSILCAAGLMLCLSWVPAESGEDPTPKSTPAASAPVAGNPPAAAQENRSLEHLRARVERFWTSKVATKYDDCYTLLTKGSRDEITMVNYIRRINTKTTAFEIDTITLDPANADHAEVMVLYKIQAMGHKMERLKYHQHWYFEEGDWFTKYVIKTPFDAKAKSATTPSGSSAGGASTTAGKTEPDPAQKQRVQELLEQIKKSRTVTKPSLNEAIAPPAGSVSSGGTPSSTPGTASKATGSTAPAADKADASVNSDSKPEGSASGKKQPAGESKPKTDPAKTTDDPKK